MTSTCEPVRDSGSRTTAALAQGKEVVVWEIAEAEDGEQPALEQKEEIALAIR